MLHSLEDGMTIASNVHTDRKMAKGLRASSQKANKSRLRSSVFSKLENERNERLFAKLLKQTSTSVDKEKEDVDMNNTNAGSS